MFLVYEGDKELVVNGYFGASFDTDPDDSKSQSGYVFILNGGAVISCSSKQSIVARSTLFPYTTLFRSVTSIYEKHILSPFQVFQDVLDHCPVIHSWITLVPPYYTYSKAHIRSGT